ncbi:MAG: hypothetical protein H6974_12965 [Gammaproteobacteria bacterium]|nr:hypothetical protein [Gammaproteobacteria bacterium]
MKINLNEASTRRGIAMFIGGCLALYHVTLGHGELPDFNQVVEKAEFWLSLAAQASGAIGILSPDRPSLENADE